MKKVFVMIVLLGLAMPVNAEYANGNYYNTSRSYYGGGNVSGSNYNTGANWNTNINSNGDMNGYDSEGNYWVYYNNTGYYYNYGTGRSCVGKGNLRTCN